MKYQLNEFGQPIGENVLGWSKRSHPTGETLQGQYCRLEHVNPLLHGDALFTAYQQTGGASGWTYLAIGPFTDRVTFDAYLKQLEASKDPLHYAIIDAATGKAMGTVALMRIDPNNGVIEVGFVIYSPALKHTQIATEAQFLLMSYVFDVLGYRRYEWKCDALNAPSHAAALRLGFKFEGIFRNAVIYKGRTRDTAWFSIISDEWAQLKRVYAKWLAKENFDENAKQYTSLSVLTGADVRLTIES